MDRGSLIGLGLAAAAVLGGQAMEGGHIGLFVQPAAFLIVVGGTLAAVLLHYPLPVFMQGMRMARWVFRPPEPEAVTLIRRVVQWSHTARQDGLLALERHVNMTHDPFQKTGLQLLIDGADAAKLRDTLDVQIVNFETNERQAARVWEAAGGYAPTLGILGAVMGLIHVMENLTEPGKLGTGIAVAFVATIYGVGLANLVFLP
ncbi:MAG: flagellar motor protein, partial [Hydrogenophilales bacterium 12-63-5]